MLYWHFFVSLAIFSESIEWGKRKVRFMVEKINIKKTSMEKGGNHTGKKELEKHP